MGRVLMIGQSEPLFEELRQLVGLDDDHMQNCAGLDDARRRLRERAWDVLLTDGGTSVADCLAVVDEMSRLWPSVRVIALWPAASDQEIIAAMRASVFACFTAPFDRGEIADMIRVALRTPEWRDGIEVISGLPNWVTLRVTCHLSTADRLTRFMSELRAAIPDDERHLLIAGFRELLLNAMEHGAGFNPDKVIQVTAAKTARAIVYHLKDPGDGFDPEDLKHAARSHDPDEIVASALTRAEMGLRPGGFGMLIARQVADELVYNERRNEVLMIKHLS